MMVMVRVNVGRSGGGGSNHTAAAHHNDDDWDQHGDYTANYDEGNDPPSPSSQL
jgi:hypothetical protein